MVTRTESGGGAPASASGSGEPTDAELLALAGLEDETIVPSREEAYGRLVAVGLWVRKDADEHLINVGLTVVELVILRLHTIHGVLDVRTLACMMKYSSVHIRNLVRGLAHRGYLERLTPPGDPRRFTTRITPRGIALHEEAHVAQDVGRAFEAIDEARRRETYHALKDVRAIDPDFARGSTGKTRGVLRNEVILRREGALPPRPDGTIRRPWHPRQRRPSRATLALANGSTEGSTTSTSTDVARERDPWTIPPEEWLHALLADEPELEQTAKLDPRPFDDTC